MRAPTIVGGESEADDTTDEEGSPAPHQPSATMGEPAADGDTQLVFAFGPPELVAPVPEPDIVSPSGDAPDECERTFISEAVSGPVRDVPSIPSDAEPVERAPDPQPDLAEPSGAALSELPDPEPPHPEPPPRTAPDPPPVPPAASMAPPPSLYAAAPASPLTRLARRPSARPQDPRSRRPLKRALQWLALLVAGLVLTLLALIVLYRFVNPPFSALMMQRWFAGEATAQTWVPLERISPQLVQAVIVSEDARFCQHWGVDLKELGAALERAREGTPRGASTISMQVAKNLFLWPAKSYVRKAIELPLTLALELSWPKRRILEVYLNIAEWGEGVFGAETAARHHFGKSAARLSEREAALLAVSLPDPRSRDAGAPGPGLSRLATTIQLRMRSAGGAAACVLMRRPRGTEPQLGRLGLAFAGVL